MTRKWNVGFRTGCVSKLAERLENLFVTKTPHSAWFPAALTLKEGDPLGPLPGYKLVIGRTNITQKRKRRL